MKSQLPVSWKRIAIALAIVFGALGLLDVALHYFGPWYEAREMGSDPQLSLLPVPVPDKSMAAVHGPAVQAFELSFRVPWEEIESEKKSARVVLVKFKEGPALIVFAPSESSTGAQPAQGTTKVDQERLRQVLGARASTYDLMEAELGATPADIRWWDRSSTMKTLVLLELKSLALLKATAVYQIGNRELRGFQIGDPSVQPTRVELDLYDVNNRRYEIWISSKDRPVSQAQINAIVASMKPIPHS